MLAQNFKTPADLQITDAEFDALVRVLGMLERGELIHNPGGLKFPNGFDMGCWKAEAECGTCACIAGWGNIVSRGAFDDVVRNNPGWINIYPEGIKRLFLDADSSVEPPQAAAALRNYLTHGEPRWDDALQVSDHQR